MQQKLYCLSFLYVNGTEDLIQGCFILDVNGTEYLIEGCFTEAKGAQ